MNLRCTGRFNEIALGRIGHELRRVRRTQNTERIAEVFEYLAAPLLTWEVGFDQKADESGNKISHLHKAIRFAAEAVAKLKPEVDVQAQKERYWNILARRAEMHIALRHVLLFEECDELEPDSFRDINVALIVAAADGDMELVRWLLRNQANPNIVHPYFGNSLHAAMGRRDSNTATLLVNRGARIHGVDKYARDALHLAAINGHVSAARSLLDIFDLFSPVMRVNPNVLDVQLRTLLIWASIRGHADVVSALVSRKDCDVNASDRDSHTALSWAIDKGDVDVVNALIVRRDLDVQKVVGPQSTLTLVYAVELHQVDKIRSILYFHKIENLDRVYAGKRTPLTQAILEHDEIVQLLIDSKRVNVNAYDGHGREWTPLRMACEFFNEDAVDRLFETGIINVHDNMHLALQHDSWEMLWELVPRLDMNINHKTMLQGRDQFTSRTILGRRRRAETTGS